MSFQKVTAIGNLGRDPELRYTPQGKAVCNFSIAVNQKKKNKDGEYEDVTLWFRCTLWDKLAETASKYLAKGDQVYVEGALHVDNWVDRDGNNRWTLELTCNQMTFLKNDRSGQQAPSQQQVPQEAAQAATAGVDDDTPDWAR